MSAQPSACGCVEPVYPLVVSNVGGLGFVSYRVGAYGDFRNALLRARDGEGELRLWSPTTGDLTLQLVEWFAYVADILTFYNEQAANNAYLGTAFLPGTVERITAVLGYRPRPGIGAKGIVGAIFAPTPSGFVTVPMSFALQSKPPPGPPQVFELDSPKPIVVPAVDQLAVDVPPPYWIDGLTIDSGTGLLLKGVVTGLKPQEEVLLAPLGQASAPDGQMVFVTSTKVEQNARGEKNTRVFFAGDVTIDGDPMYYGLFRSSQTMGASAFSAASTEDLHLAGLARSLTLGDAVRIPNDSKIKTLSHYAEEVVSPSTTVAVLQSVIQLKEGWPDRDPTPVDVSSAYSIQFGFRPFAVVIPESPTSLPGDATGATLVLDAPARADVVTYGSAAIVEDARGNGVVATVTAPEHVDDLTQAHEIDVSIDQPRDLTLPLSMLFALLPVSRGKTVSNEVVGSGDATSPGQLFTLQNAPLTYFAGSDPDFPTSTLRVWVNGVQWKEVKSFYEQPPDAQIFVTRETVDQKTQVIFGDGVNGARLPTGKSNVVATYRYGSGKDSPPVGSLTNILKPVPGLRSVRNPIAVAGGDDPQPPDKVRRYAPESVLTFGRAISASDYEAVAAQAPAVTRARAYYAWDVDRQRALVKVYVGDDDDAVASARHALDSARDPNLPLSVARARAFDLVLSFSLAVDERYDADAVSSAVAAKLGDPDTGLLSPRRMRIGERLYESKVVAEALSVPGALAVHGLYMGNAHYIIDYIIPPSVYILDPGEGGYFALSPSHLHVSVE